MPQHQVVAISSRGDVARGDACAKAQDAPGEFAAGHIVAAIGRRHGVGAVTEVEQVQVVAIRTGDGVVARAADEGHGRTAEHAHQDVIARAALEPVAGAVRHQQVVAGQTEEGLGGFGANDQVLARGAGGGLPP